MDFLSLDGVDAFDVFIQANVQSIVTISSYSDVTCSRFKCFFLLFSNAFTFNFNCGVKFIFVYNAFVVTSEFQAVISSSNFVFVVVAIFVNDTSHTVSTVFTVYAVLTVSTFESKTIFTVFTIQADRAVFTVDYNSRTVFTVYTDLTVNTWFTVFTVITNFDIVGQCIVVSMVASYFINDLFNS